MTSKKIPYIQTTLRMTEEMLKEARKRALFINVSLNTYLLQALIEKMQREDLTR